MTNVKRLTVIALCMASCMGVAAQNGTSTQIPGSSEQPADSLPAQWDLQACIDYALQQKHHHPQEPPQRGKCPGRCKDRPSRSLPQPFGQCEPACRESPEERDKHHHRRRQHHQQPEQDFL